jgi:hypothetical protein
MEWYHVLSMVLGNAAVIIPLWLWSRSESRSDHRHMEAWVKASIDGMREEMKDFHGRLCAIEERYRSK